MSKSRFPFFPKSRTWQGCSTSAYESQSGWWSEQLFIILLYKTRSVVIGLRSDVSSKIASRVDILKRVRNILIKSVRNIEYRYHTILSVHCTNLSPKPPCYFVDMEWKKPPWFSAFNFIIDSKNWLFWVVKFSHCLWTTEMATSKL